LHLETSWVRKNSFLAEGVGGVMSYEKEQVSQLRRDSFGDCVLADAAGAVAGAASVDDDENLGIRGVGFEIGLVNL